MSKSLFIIFLFSLVISLGSCKKATDITANPPSGSTKTPPSVTTNSISNLTLYSVYLGGKIISNGTATPSEQGILISRNPNPTVGNALYKFTMQKDGSNSFQSKIRGVEPNTTYFVKAYAISNDGIGYGNEINFTSPIEKRAIGLQILSSQQDVIDFAQLGYNSVSRLHIGGTITDLSPLQGLVIVYQDLEIGGNLTNLHGLHNLEIVRDFILRYNTSLPNLSGLDNLEATTGEFQIMNCSGLTSLNGVNKLLIVGYQGLGNFWIKDCPNIQNLTGLENLQSITSDLNIRGNISLTDITALRKLGNVNGTINIMDNSALSNFCALKPLFVGGFNQPFNTSGNALNPTISYVISNCP
jgi:hypothetical protein